MKPHDRSFGYVCALLVIAIAIVGCANAKVTPQVSRAPALGGRPGRIVAYDFAVDATEVTPERAMVQRQLNRMSAVPDQQRRLDIGHEAAKSLSERTVKDLQEMGFIAVRLPRTARELSPGDVIVDGKFVDVNEGNRLRRLVIGFGAGSSSLDSEVEVFQVLPEGTRKVLEFKTHADSGKLPGAAVTMGAGAAVSGGATVAGAAAASGMAAGKTYTSQVDHLAAKTSDQVVAYLSQYFANQGWIPQDQVRKANVESSSK